MKKNTSLSNKTLLLSAGFIFVTCQTYARVGGGGGGSHSGGSSHSSSHSSSYSHSSSSYSGGSGSVSVGSGFGFFLVLLFAFFVLVVVLKAKKAMKNGDFQRFTEAENQRRIGAFPEGLPPEKVTTAFMELQQAWQQQDLSKVRQWMSDGVYQRFTAQLSMMKKLTQHNRLSNINIFEMEVANRSSDGAYETVDIAISFSMDDAFICEKYPQLNQSFEEDTATEYWTFIKRKDAKAGANGNLYTHHQCPNCGAALDNMLGEVSRCTSCHTLTNNASYDWILSEITQEDDYTEANELLQDTTLQELVKNDPLFAIQRVEDIASNVFMQIMEVLTGDNNKKLSRFANKALANDLIQQKEKMGSFVFDRLYLSEVTLIGYNTVGNRLNLNFSLTASYQRVRTESKLVLLDKYLDAHFFEMTLSKDLDSLNSPAKEVTFSYECASCGAPYDDTTNDTCSYCDAPVVDTSRNWVLTKMTLNS